MAYEQNDLTDDELARRIEELTAAGMTLAANALQREQAYRKKRAA